MNSHMVITIDDKICKENNISMEELLVLEIAYHRIDIKETIKNLLNKNIGYKDPFNESNLILSSLGRDFVDKVILYSDKEIKRNEEFFKEIASEMRELYPKGKKPGTNYMWRASEGEIAKRLAIVSKKFNSKFTKEEVLEATKRFVESFNGNYMYMPLLKYFIFKNKTTSEGVEPTSDMLSYIENKDQCNNTNDDWTTELR